MNMELNDAVKSKIEEYVNGNRVVLFMKGTRQRPMCGFSAKTVAALDSVVPDYLTINVLGPVCTQILGDMGANVIKVEPPGGDPMRKLGPGHEQSMAAHFMAMNRNKRSLELNLKRPEALTALKAVIAKADVLVHSMRAAATQSQPS